MIKKLCLLILYFTIHLFAAFELQQLNSEIVANGGITSLHYQGNNPAISNMDYKFIISSNYTNLFGIKDLHCWDIGIVYNFHKNNSIFFKTNSIGDKLYQENTYSLSYSRKFDIPISIGIALEYYNLTIDNFPTENAIGITTGICYFLNEKVRVATLFGNVNRPRICKNKELLPEYFAFGLHWKFHHKIEISSELFKDTIYPFNSRFGVKINMHNNIKIYSGLQTNPDRFSSGISIQIFNLNFISSMQSHLKLPNTYYFGCTFFIK